jgi:hypothetical protein
MTTDINNMYQTLNNYMSRQIEIYSNLDNNAYVNYDTDVYVDKSLYNAETFNYIVNNMCNTPPNRLIHYDPSTLSIKLIKDNYRFEIQGYSSAISMNYNEVNTDNDNDYAICVELKPYNL